MANESEVAGDSDEPLTIRVLDAGRGPVTSARVLVMPDAYELLVDAEGRVVVPLSSLDPADGWAEVRAFGFKGVDLPLLQTNEPRAEEDVVLERLPVSRHVTLRTRGDSEPCGECAARVRHNGAQTDLGFSRTELRVPILTESTATSVVLGCDRHTFHPPNLVFDPVVDGDPVDEVIVSIRGRSRIELRSDELDLSRQTSVAAIPLAGSASSDEIWSAVERAFYSRGTARVERDGHVLTLGHLSGVPYRIVVGFGDGGFEEFRGNGLDATTFTVSTRPPCRADVVIELEGSPMSGAVVLPGRWTMFEFVELLRSTRGGVPMSEMAQFGDSRYVEGAAACWGGGVTDRDGRTSIASAVGGGAVTILAREHGMLYGTARGDRIVAGFEGTGQLSLKTEKLHGAVPVMPFIADAQMGVNLPFELVGGISLDSSVIRSGVRLPFGSYVVGHGVDAFVTVVE